ncbi:MAG: hypothetical protein ACHQF2_03425 [Flavobacteriales bacterium]
MPLTGDEAEEFDLATAEEWCANYRTANPSGIKAHFFGYRLILRILGQRDCVGMRMYYAMDNDDVQWLILVGVKADGTDMTDGIIGETSLPCPQMCDTTSTLYDNT